MREGPRVVRECIGCKHLGSQSYRVQGDSGIDYWCNHPSRNDTNRTIGDTTCKTPEWCPFLKPTDPNAAFRWICPKCSTVNGIQDAICLGGSCGTHRP